MQGNGGRRGAGIGTPDRREADLCIRERKGKLAPGRLEKEKGERPFGSALWIGRTEFTSKIGSDRDWQRNRGAIGNGKWGIYAQWQPSGTVN